MQKQYSLFMCVLLCTPVVAEIAKDELLQKLTFASQPQIETATFQGQITQERSSGLSIEAVLQKTTEYQERLINELKKGQLPFSPRQIADLEKEQGVSIETLMGDPTFRKGIDRVIERRVEDYKRDLLFTKADTRQVSQVKYWLDSSGRGRKEWTMTDASIGNQFSEDLMKISGTKTVNYGVAKSLQEGLKVGSIDQGSAQSRASYVGVFEMIDLSRAGRPFLFSKDPEDIKSIRSNVVDGQSICKVIFCREQAPGRYDTLIVEYLPECNYAIKTLQEYSDGNLVAHYTYGKYQEIEPGVWFPMEQEYTDCAAELTPEAAEQLRSGKASYDDESLLAQQIVKKKKMKTFRFTSVSMNEDMPEELFDLTFPLGITVLDHTRKTADGRVFHYVVGSDPDISNSALKNLDTTQLDVLDVNAVTAAQTPPPALATHTAPPVRAALGRGTDVNAPRLRVGFLLCMVGLPCLAGLGLVFYLLYRKHRKTSAMAAV